MESVVKSTAADGKLDQLKAILFLLQTNLEDFKNEVDSSYELLKIGEMTDLSKQIREDLDRPWASAFKASQAIDDHIKHILDRFVKMFLMKSKNYLSEAFRSKTTMDDLHYTLVLKEDTADNRERVSSFLDEYDLWDIAHNYPIHFQFIAPRFRDKIRYSERIEL